MIGQHSFQLLHWDGSLEPFVGTLDMPRLPCSEEAQIEKGLVKQELLPAAPFSVIPFPMSEDDSRWSQIPAAGVSPSKGPLAEASDTKRQGWEPWSARLAVGQNHGVQIQVREASLQDGDMRSQILICVWRNILGQEPSISPDDGDCHGFLLSVCWQRTCLFQKVVSGLLPPEHPHDEADQITVNVQPTSRQAYSVVCNVAIMGSST